MAIRTLKIVLVVFVALLGLLYAVQNLANLDVAYQFVASVVGEEDHVLYPSSVGFAVQSPALIWAILAIIITGELAVGLLSAKGAWDLWRERNADAAQFNAAKTYALLGAGMAMIVWFGLFIVLAGAYFQMWQTEIGQASLAGSFQNVGASGIVLLFVNIADD